VLATTSLRIEENTVADKKAKNLSLIFACEEKDVPLFLKSAL